MIKHGYCPTCGTYTVESSYVDGLDNRQERDDYLTDAEIAVAVRESLTEADPSLKGIEVTVLNSVVTLRGQVKDKAVKALASEQVFGMPEVMDVQNFLTLESVQPAQKG